MPVTYYDFHWNYRADWDQAVTIFRGNPDFEYGDYGYGGLYMGMVQDTLDSEFKPVLGPTVYYNAGIRYWFRSCDGPVGQFRRPGYRPDGTLTSTTWQTIPYDTVYKNVVILDSLPFILIDSVLGTYLFDSDSNEPYKSMGGFFPIDNRGFGTEGNPWGRNYAFTMEVQQPFRYKAGLVFDFTGDDDMWVFVNKKLVLDMGGVRNSAMDGGFNLDAEAARLGLELGKTYTISVFYTERHVSGSNCRITTNIFMPNQLFIEVIGSDTLVAGVSRQVLKAVLVDENGDALPDSVASDVTWSIISLNRGDSILNPGKKGQIATVLSTKA